MTEPTKLPELYITGKLEETGPYCTAQYSMEKREDGKVVLTLQDIRIIPDRAAGHATLNCNSTQHISIDQAVWVVPEPNKPVFTELAEKMIKEHLRIHYL